jgi:FlaG/FlaF family flagellin (archaellin)
MRKGEMVVVVVVLQGLFMSVVEGFEMLINEKLIKVS